MVPAVSSSKLLARNEANRRVYVAYVDQTARFKQPVPPLPTPPTPTIPDSYDAQPSLPPMDASFPHLLAMFQSGANGQTGQFHRVLAYLGVPTPFAHFTVQADPDYTGAAGQHWFHQPFNGIATYREPGRINLNTISSSDVFMGLLNFHPGLATADYVAEVRRQPPRRFDYGHDDQPGLSEPLHASLPHRGRGLAYAAFGRRDDAAFPKREIDATLMREDPSPDPSVQGPNLNIPGRPLFQVDDLTMSTTASNPPYPPPALPATPDQFQNAAMDYNRSPYFRYQGLQKLAGTTTTHSNVFAIWITVGYFEVTPATPTQLKATDALGNTGTIYPDGYQLGQELGADTGDVVRHRAFYIFDRSLPVGYIRGQDVNTAKAFLLQRYIE